MTKLHNDVLDTIIDSQLDRIISGENITTEELVELLLLHRERSERAYKEMSETALEFGKIIIDRQNTIKIYNLFLRNYGLEEKFENFLIRILRRLYKE